MCCSTVRPKPKRRCPTLKQFAPRFIDGHARANRQKPSGIAAKERTAPGVTCVPFARSQAAGCDHDRRRPAAESLDGDQGAEDRQQRPDGAERAAEEGRRVGRDRTDAVHDPAAADSEGVSKSFHDFDQYERLVEAARAIDRDHGADRAAGRRGRTAVRRDDRARVERHRSGQAATLRAAVGLEWPGHVAEGRPATVRSADAPTDGSAARASTPERARACSVRTMARRSRGRQVQYRVKRAARQANVARGRPRPSAHVLFAPGDAWRAGAGHSGTRRTQRSRRRRSATCT